MTDSETRAYYARRADTERRLASGAISPAAAAAHRALATAYAARAADDTSEPASSLKPHP